MKYTDWVPSNITSPTATTPTTSALCDGRQPCRLTTFSSCIEATFRLFRLLETARDHLVSRYFTFRIITLYRWVTTAIRLPSGDQTTKIFSPLRAMHRVSLS